MPFKNFDGQRTVFVEKPNDDGLVAARTSKTFTICEHDDVENLNRQKWQDAACERQLDHLFQQWRYSDSKAIPNHRHQASKPQGSCQVAQSHC